MTPRISKAGLAHLLKSYRRIHNLSQIDAARAFAVPLRTWEGWEQRSGPIPHKLRVLSYILSQLYPHNDHPFSKN